MNAQREIHHESTLNLAWQLNDTIIYSVTASQTCQSECKVPSKRQSFFPFD